ncbi:MAG: TonB-dependent receptor, partial [Deltaproteobacteria bacterium]|nr:TonB-dependent receptor [Deltaproteobacteria bacterium]
NYRFSGSGQNAGLRSTPRGSLENSKYKYRSYSGRLGYDWDGGSVYVRAEDYQSTIHIPTNVSSGYIVSPMSAAFILANTTNVILDLPKWDRRTFGAGLELNDPVPHMVKFKLDLYHQNMKKDFFNTILMRNFNLTTSSDTIQRMPMHTYNDQDSFGGILQTDWRLGDHYVIFGLDYNKDKLDADDERDGTFLTNVLTGVTTQMAGPSAFKYTAEQSIIGLFLQDEWKLPSDFTATLGARNTWVKSSMGPHDNPDLPHPPDSSDSKLVGNVGLVYTGFNNFALRASWAQGYKFPPLNDLYMGTVHGSNNPTLPNPDLKPETSNNLELGLRYNNGALSLDFAAFYSMAKNYITTRPSTVPATGAPATQFFNSDEATTMGFELGASYDIDSLGLTPYASVAYISRETKDNITVRSRFPLPAGTRRQEVLETKNTGTPPFTGRLGLRFDKDLDDSFIFHSDAYVEMASKARQTYFDSTGAHDVNGTGNPLTYDYDFATDEYPGWTTFNVTVGLEWGEEHKWNAALAARNIFDREYFRANNANMDPGFNIMASLGFEY